MISPGSASEEDIEDLRETWKTLYGKTLPSLAHSKDGAQQKWPVSLDHCFARIILDNTIGARGVAVSDYEPGQTELVSWDTVCKKPAVRNMTPEQLRAAIELGEKIKSGAVDLCELDRRSLAGRGKNQAKYGLKQESNDGKRKRTDDENASRRKTEEDKKAGKSLQIDNKKQAMLSFTKSSQVDSSHRERSTSESGLKISRVEQLEHDLSTSSHLSADEIRLTLRRIKENNSLTPFRRRLYISLLSVPRGQYTTYAAMALHLNSVARAVGNGMRNNPFAPDVPCHRVLASDGSIGGFGGDWSRDGTLTEKQEKKVELLKEEGVRFDSAGKVKGPVWKGFWNEDDFAKKFGPLDD